MPYEYYHLLPRTCYVLWYLVKIIVNVIIVIIIVSLSITQASFAALRTMYCLRFTFIGTSGKGLTVYTKRMALQDIPSSRQDAEHYDYIILLSKVYQSYGHSNFPPKLETSATFSSSTAWAPALITTLSRSTPTARPKTLITWVQLSRSLYTHAWGTYLHWPSAGSS